MGYRSDVRIRLTKEDFERLKKEFEDKLIKTKLLEWNLFDHLDIYKEEKDTIIYIQNKNNEWEEKKVESVYFGWNGLKWYEFAEFADVDFIMDFVENCKQYAFIRIGESGEGDIETREDGFDMINYYHAFDDDDNVYEQKYTYEHLKVACVVQDYIINHRHEMKEDIVYEDIAKMTSDIYDAHKKESFEGTLNEEEFAYIQAFAYRYLEEYFEGERK